MPLSTVGQQQILQSINPRQAFAQGQSSQNAGGQGGGSNASAVDLLGNLERMISDLTNRGGGTSLVQDAFRDRVEQFRVTRRSALTSARDQVQESLDRVGSLVGDRLPHLRDLIDVGPEAAEAFDQERNSVVAFAGGLPIVDTQLIRGASDVSGARKAVLGMQNDSRIPAANEDGSPFNGFKTPRDVSLARRRVDQEISQTLPRTIEQFQTALLEIKKQLEGEPSSLPMPAKMDFPFGTAREFFSRFSDEISLITSNGEPTYRGNLQVLGEFFFFGSPRGGNGNRLL